MAFTYDKTYQLTAEFGRYASNFMPFMSFMVSNQFAYDPAGNRISHSSTLPTFHSSSYLHTSDNQLTGIFWNTDKLNLGGIVQDCWTAHWVKVKQSTAATWVPAQLKLRKGQDVAWLATNVPVSGTGTLSFDLQAQITNNYVVTQTVSYTHSSNLPSFQSSIAYAYDANGNRTEKWTNNLFAARYFYDADNQLLGISFDNDQNYSDAGDYAYSYDPFGRRISATEDGVTRYFAYDGLDCIAELDSNANVKKWYLRGSGLGGGIGDIIAEVSPTTTNYYCYNHRGDVVTLTSKDAVLTARYEYIAFGTPLTPTTSVRPLTFSSKEYETKSGLSYYGFRYYDAESGRWLTKDPLLWESDINCYRHARNNSVVYQDLYGLYSFEGCECVDEKRLRHISSTIMRYRVMLLNKMRARWSTGHPISYDLAGCVNQQYASVVIRCFFGKGEQGFAPGDAMIPGKIQVDANLQPDRIGWIVAHEVGHKCLGGVVNRNPDTWNNFPGHTLHDIRDFYDPKDFNVDILQDFLPYFY